MQFVAKVAQKTLIMQTTLCKCVAYNYLLLNVATNAVGHQRSACEKR